MKPLNIVSVVFAIAAGVATLVLLFVPLVSDLLTFDGKSGLTILLGWVTTLAAAALLVGLLNLLAVHFRKASAFNLNSIYSGIFLLTFVGILFIWTLGTIARALPASSARDTLASAGQITVDFAFKYIQTPVEASLSAVLAVVMVLAGARLIRTRRHWSAVLFIIVAFFLLVGLAPIYDITILRSFRDGLISYLAVGASRGILLGIALGVIATGLRVIVGVDQPYGE